MGCGISKPKTTDLNRDTAPLARALSPHQELSSTASNTIMTESAAAEAKTADLNRYTAPHAIWEALATDTVKLLRASSLVELAKEGGVLCRRQELPPEAFIGVEELKSLYGDGNRDGVLPILSVSFCWDTPQHPDPSGKQLATVAAALEREMPEYAKMGFTEMGVFWDVRAHKNTNAPPPHKRLRVGAVDERLPKGPQEVRRARDASGQA